MSTSGGYHHPVPSATRRRAPRKQPGRYHHGNLRRALVQEAAAIIGTRGIDALTLRAVSDSLGVSRTAMYRHFADKSDLLAAVAAEGFRRLRAALGGSFDAMGHGYVRFAMANPAHYRVMFGGFVREHRPDTEVAIEGAAAFQVLVDALVGLQQEGTIRRDDPRQLATYIWSVVHGIAMLAIDGQIGDKQAVDSLTEFSIGRLRTGISATKGV